MWNFDYFLLRRLRLVDVTDSVENKPDLMTIQRDELKALQMEHLQKVLYLDMRVFDVDRLGLLIIDWHHKAPENGYLCAF